MGNPVAPVEFSNEISEKIFRRQFLTFECEQFLQQGLWFGMLHGPEDSRLRAGFERVVWPWNAGSTNKMFSIVSGEQR